MGKLAEQGSKVRGCCRLRRMVRSSYRRAIVQESYPRSEFIRRRSPAQSTLMLVEDLFDFLHAEVIKLHELGLRAHRGRHDGAGVLAALHVRDDPGFVLAVLASPVRMRQEMGACLEKYFNHPSTGYTLGLMWDLNQKSRHRTNLLFAGLSAILRSRRSPTIQPMTFP